MSVVLLTAGVGAACFGLARMPMQNVNAYTLALFDCLGLDPVEHAMRTAELNVGRYPFETVLGKRFRYRGAVAVKYSRHEQAQHRPPSRTIF